MRKLELVGDCGACAGLCCVAHPFDRSEDFAFDKGAGERCRHLLPNDRCAVHGRREELGCRGCVLYDCFGAGQRAVAQFAEVDQGLRDRAFLVLRGLHEQLWLLREAGKWVPPGDAGADALRERLAAQVKEVECCAEGSAVEVAAAGDGIERRTRAVLREVGRWLGRG